jgi:hypothetical protein
VLRRGIVNRIRADIGDVVPFAGVLPSIDVISSLNDLLARPEIIPVL